MKVDLWRVTVSTTSEAADAVETLLLDSGALGTEVVDVRDIERERERGFGEWVDPEVLAIPPEGALVSAYTEMANGEEQPPVAWMTQVQTILQAVRTSGLDAGSLHVTTEAVPAASYEEAWKAHYHRIAISERIQVIPLWERDAVQKADWHTDTGGAGEEVAGETSSRAGVDDRIAIYMDPGMAFGTGTHETTTLCLRAMEKLVQPGRTRLLDIGTGSGILAIAAAKLGVQHVVAVDLDERAVGIARDNALENGLGELFATGQFTCNVSDLLSHVPTGSEFDIVMANLLAGLVMQVAPEVRRVLAKGGCLIASGLVEHQTEDVLSALRSAGFTQIQQERLGDWVALLAFVE